MREYASKVVMWAPKAIRGLAETIPNFPVSGRVVSENEDKYVREKLYKTYRIVYRISNVNERIEILSVFHQAHE